MVKDIVSLDTRDATFACVKIYLYQKVIAHAEDILSDIKIGTKRTTNLGVFYDLISNNGLLLQADLMPDRNRSHELCKVTLPRVYAPVPTKHVLGMQKV